MRHTLLLYWLCALCACADSEPRDQDRTPDAGAPDQAADDMADPLDAPADLALDQGADLPPATDMAPAEDQPADLTQDMLQPADHGQPDLDPGQPVMALGPVERVAPASLTQHIEHPSWMPQEDALYLSVSVGGDKAVMQTEGQPKRSPWTTWRLDTSTAPEQLGLRYRLPVDSAEETNWCRWSMSRQQHWCYSNHSKANERILHILSGDGDLTPAQIEADHIKTCDSPSSTDCGGHLHEYMLDFAERSDGTLYWTLNKNGGMLLASPPDKPLRLNVVAPLTIDRAGQTVRVTANGVHGVALSPDERTLYFTTVGREGDLGALWSAPVRADGTLDAPTPLVEGLATPRGLTVDAAGNIYVAHGLDVQVYAPSGALNQTLPIITDPAERMALESARQKYRVLGVTFGGHHGNVLYAAIGYDRAYAYWTTEPRNLTHTKGGLWRVPLSVAGAWTLHFPPTP